MTDALDLAELKRLLATDSEINTLNRFYSSGQYSASEEAIFDAAAKELFELRRLSGALIARLEQAEAALSEAQAELEAAREKCAQAAKWFREYEAQHAAKGTVDGEQKAMRNAYRAMVLEGAIEPPSAALSAPKAEDRAGLGEGG